MTHHRMPENDQKYDHNCANTNDGRTTPNSVSQNGIHIGQRVTSDIKAWAQFDH